MKQLKKVMVLAAIRVFVKFLRFESLPEFFRLCFLFRRLTLFFRFTFVHTAKLKKSNFLNDFFLSLTAFARVTSFLTRFSQKFLVYLRD